MSIFLADESETYGYETFLCGRCSRDFKARVITWVDVSRTPQARSTILRQKFNVIQCSHCGARSFADVPFFYEDFAEGLLIAVLPGTENSNDERARVRERYGHYPHLAYFDMTRLWLLVYLQGFYGEDRGARTFAEAGNGEKRTLRLLRFLMHDPVMAAIGNKLDDIFSGAGGEGENLAALLGQAVYRVEGLHPWPLDRRCICGAEIVRGLACSQKPMDFNEHALFSRRRPGIERQTMAHAVCGRCGRSYTGELGVVESFEGGEDAEHLFSPARCSIPQNNGRL